MFPINRNHPRPSTICFLLTLCLTAWSAFGRPSPEPTPTQAAVAQQTKTINASAAKLKARIQPICETQLGWRTRGTNPIREQVEAIEPHPDSWRKISLEMRKEDGLRLWIELLRSLDWIADYEAIAGQTIFLDLEEMGAVGDAEVTAIEPCPPIQRGPGGIVTGIFKHESDGKNVVLLTIEGEAEPTTVTSNHLYWSADRHNYIPAGDVHKGERLDTEFGHHRVVSVVPHPNYTGLLYNLETTEHVFRVGSNGALVHNSCWKVGIHGKMPSPRPNAESHHGVMSRWMKAIFGDDYKPAKAPAVLMPKENHNKTRAYFNTWKSKMAKRQNVDIDELDWSAISESEMRKLSNNMFKAAKTPKNIQQAYWKQFDDFLSILQNAAKPD